MTSWVSHLIAPLLLAFVVMPVERWRIFAWAPLVWLPDADWVVQDLHRTFTHTALWPLGLVVAVVVLWRRRDPTARFLEFATRPGAPANLLLAAYFLSTHILLDIFTGGVVLLWPLLDVNAYVGLQIFLDTGSNTFDAAPEADTSQGAPTVAPVYTWLSRSDSAMLALAAVMGAAWAWRTWRGAQRPDRPVIRWRKASIRNGEDRSGEGVLP